MRFEALAGAKALGLRVAVVDDGRRSWELSGIVLVRVRVLGPCQGAHAQQGRLEPIRTRVQVI